MAARGASAQSLNAAAVTALEPTAGENGLQSAMHRWFGCTRTLILMLPIDAPAVATGLSLMQLRAIRCCGAVIGQRVLHPGSAAKHQHLQLPQPSTSHPAPPQPSLCRSCRHLRIQLRDLQHGSRRLRVIRQQVSAVQQLPLPTPSPALRLVGGLTQACCTWRGMLVV
jgi:hypothetical protein